MLLEGGDKVNTSEQLVSLIRELIREEISKKDASSICQIASVNENGTVNIILPSDPDTIIPNIKNTSGYEFVSGDYGVLYKIENKLNNSFIFSKIIATPPVTKIIKKDDGDTPTPPVINNITYRIDTAPLNPTDPESEKVQYGFKLQNSGAYAGYWKSQNKGIDNSYALCRIYFKGKGSLTLHCESGGEAKYDFGIIGQIGQDLSRSNTVDTNVKYSFQSTAALVIANVDFNDIDTNGEEWYIECKYKKDGSRSDSLDALYFKMDVTKFLVQQDDSVADYYVSKSDENLSKIPFTIQQ